MGGRGDYFFIDCCFKIQKNVFPPLLLFSSIDDNEEKNYRVLFPLCIETWEGCGGKFSVFLPCVPCFEKDIEKYQIHGRGEDKMGVFLVKKMILFF